MGWALGSFQGRFGPGVCGVRVRLRSGVCEVWAGLWTGPGVCWSWAGPWGLGSGVGCGLEPGICWGWGWGVLEPGCAMGLGWPLGCVGAGLGPGIWAQG